MASPLDGACFQCVYWAPRTDETQEMGGGYCRRFPPVFKLEKALNDGWPNTHRQSWCGEFERRRRD